MINTEALAAAARKMTALLEVHKNNVDVQYLLSNERFMRLVDDAANQRIFQPVDLGLERWVLESNIRSCNDIRSVISELYFLFRGEPVPV